jgi:hypothetical protein
MQTSGTTGLAVPKLFHILLLLLPFATGSLNIGFLATKQQSQQERDLSHIGETMVMPPTKADVQKRVLCFEQRRLLLGVKRPRYPFMFPKPPVLR